MSNVHAFAVAAMLSATAAAASAGTYANISVDGSFADWATVPVASADGSADGAPIDIANVQIANDASNLYLRVTYHTAVNPNTGPSLFLAFDTDNNVATGFDIYGLGIVGSEAGYQNDFPFDQRTGFNVGAINGAAAISPVNFANSATTTLSQEYSIPRNATYASDNASVFGNSFTLMLWTDGNPADASAGMAYTFALVPEPASMSVIAAGMALVARRRRA